ncbi:phosphoribosylglycinamide formyltransferase [Caldanaerobius polysaccharolyticus]|uniref:phosphoribosylglycinamide formyltransferase n=1 Tax=Caldanaerobius polysaccharolyticus TaxID=44256 RepID=UPI00047DA882|nr:phosphoribosylglycinamide formyltransferase [Caldanaerobius polysaccharolyticus]
MNRVVVLVSGGGTNLQAIIDSVKSGYLNVEIAAVISDRPEAYALERARLNGIQALCLSRKELGREKFNKELLDTVAGYQPDLVVLAGFLTILSSEFVDRFQGRIINIHPSLIPSFCGKGYYGEKVHKAAIEYGVKISGCTVHFVDAGTDTGPIIFQEAVPVKDDDTPETLGARILQHEHKLLPKAIKYYFDGKLKVQGRRVYISY